MKLCILGLGVIGTTYGYIFQKAGHQIEHLVRDNKKDNVPEKLNVTILDGRYDNEGEEKTDTYAINLAKPNTSYDFILISVGCGKIKEAIMSLSQNNITGSLLLFCNFWNSREEIEKMVGNYKYIIGFPTAGGNLEQSKLSCVLFDHIMLESEEKSMIPNYKDLMRILKSADVKAEIPYDMVEWIWVHMAINAGVTSTAARAGKLDNPKKLAVNLMGNAHALSIAVKSIRETVKVVQARGVNLKLYKNELLPYKIPSSIAGIVMKRMFAGNELTSRIMMLHNDVKDIMYGCKSVYETGKQEKMDLPLFYSNMERLFNS